MYRDDPLPDEEELRAILGDDAVDGLFDAAQAHDTGAEGPFEVAVAVLRVLQGWVDDDAAEHWFTTPQRRLEDRTPITALCDGAYDEVRDAARQWAAAQG